MNAPAPKETGDVRAMTADSIGKDILSALVQEIKLLPDVWQKLPENKQNDIIDRLRKRVETNVRMAVHLIASSARPAISATLDSVTIKDEIKGVVLVGKGNPARHDLCDAQGKSVLIVIADSTENTGGMNDVKGEKDQRALDLGKEHEEDDGGGMPEGGASSVIEGEARMLPAPEVEPSEEELEEQREAGYQAAADGQPESACPVMKGALCIAWVKGWKEWHEQNPAEGNQ